MHSGEQIDHSVAFNIGHLFSMPLTPLLTGGYSFLAGIQMHETKHLSSVVHLRTHLLKLAA